MEDVFIYDAVRTPRGKGKPAQGDKPGGALCGIAPQDIVYQLVSALSDRLGPGFLPHTQRLVLGCVGQIKSQGGHIALVSRLASELSDTASVLTLNNYCVSGLSAFGDTYYRALSGTDGLMLSGGVECLSQVGFFEDQAAYYTDPNLIRTLKWAPPIMGAELLATIEGFTKEDLDQLTLKSHQRATDAWAAGYYDTSVIPVTGVDDNIILDRDEYVINGPSAAVVRYAKPAFGHPSYTQFDEMMLSEHPELARISHVHSVANCPGPADGAALIVSGTKHAGDLAGLQPKARIISFAETTDDPVVQFSAGFTAMEKALDAADLEIADLDLIEFMEAFAAPPLKFLRDYAPDPDRVNVNGGHLAMGHPMGATGAILLTTLVHELERRDLKTGMAVALAGSGIGGAIVLERV